MQLSFFFFWRKVECQKIATIGANESRWRRNLSRTLAINLEQKAHLEDLAEASSSSASRQQRHLIQMPTATYEQHLVLLLRLKARIIWSSERSFETKEHKMAIRTEAHDKLGKMKRSNQFGFFAFEFFLLFWCFLPCRCSAVSGNVACDSHVQTNVCLPRNYSSMDLPLINTPNKVQFLEFLIVREKYTKLDKRFNETIPFLYIVASVLWLQNSPGHE